MANYDPKHLNTTPYIAFILLEVVHMEILLWNIKMTIILTFKNENNIK